VKTYRRKGHAEHDDQHYVPQDELQRWAATNDPVDRYVQRLLEAEWADEAELQEIDARVRDEVDRATDACVNDPLPDAETALPGVYAAPPAAERLWYRGL
jgi:pyruvate dehydrogenase E1 component alpha subunit/2-oxoisovalerate dehydrogenase E1 component alpha subunit